MRAARKKAKPLKKKRKRVKSDKFMVWINIMKGVTVWQEKTGTAAEAAIAG